MNRLPFLIPLAALTGGILLADFAGAAYVTAAFLSVFAAFLALAMRFAKRRGFIADMRAQRLREPAVVALFLAVGILSATIARPRLPDTEDPGLPRFADVRITRVRHMTYGDVADGNLLGFCENADDSTLLTRSRGVGVRLTFKDIMAKPGDVIRFPHDFSPAGVDNNYFSNDAAVFLKRKGIFFSQKLHRGEGTLAGESHTLSTRASAMRDRLSELVESTPVTHRTAALLRTVILGDSDAVSNGDREIFSSSGLAHLLSLSGLHTGLAAALVMFALLPLNLTRRRKWRYAVALLFLWTYVTVTGAHIPAVRAAVMMTFYIGGLALERDSQPMNALLAAAFLILLITPTALYDCGFQLSCVCVFSLVGFTQYLAPDRLRKYPFTHSMVTAVSAPLITTFASWALVAYYFGRLPMMFIPANLIAVPLLTLFMGAGGLLLILASLGMRPHFFSEVVNRLSDFLYSITEFFSNDKFNVSGLEISGITVICWLIIVISLYIATASHGRRRVFATSTSLCAVAFIGVICSIAFTSKDSLDDGLIIHDNYSEIAFSTRENNIENVIHLNSKITTDTVICGNTIRYLNDRRFYKNSRTRREIPTNAEKVDIVIIGNGFYGTLEDILQYYRPEIIVGHKTLTVDMDVSLQSACGKLKIPYHSIREQGAYRHMEP